MPLPLNVRQLDDLPSLIREAWAVGREIDLTGIGYGRIHWGNHRDVVTAPYPYYHFLAGLVRVTGASRILEIGTHSGGSIRAMRTGLRTSEGAVLVTVDITAESDAYLGDEPLVTKIQGDANTEELVREVSELFQGQRCDLLYIDAAHEFWPTLQNVALYSLVLRPRLIVLDDITLNASMAGVWRFLCDALPAGAALDATQIEPAVRPVRPPAAKGPGFGVLAPARCGTPSRVHLAPRSPVLVLGCVRSGTSALHTALQAAGGYAGGQEGHFLAILKSISDAVDAYYRSQGHVRRPGLDAFLVNRIPPSDAFHACAAAVRDLVQEAYGGAAWIDKTPAGWSAASITAVPILANALPGAQFVYVQRRGLEVVRSAALKWPDIDFAEVCRWWAQTVDLWASVQEAVSGRVVMVEHRDMVERPDTVAEQLRELLKLSPASAEKLAHSLRTQFPERTPGLEYSPESIDALGWSDEQRQVFRRICGPAMERLCYGYGSSYYVD